MYQKHSSPQQFSQINSLAMKCNHILRRLDTSAFRYENTAAAEMNLIALECCQILENPSTQEIENTCMNALANLIKSLSIYEDDTITEACYRIARLVIRKYSTSIILDECTPFVVSELAFGFSRFCEDELNPDGVMLKATEVIAEIVNVEYEQDELQSFAFYTSSVLTTSFTKWLGQTQGRTPIKTSVSYLAHRLMKMNNLIEKNGRELSSLVKTFSLWYTHDPRMSNVREVVLYFAEIFLVQYEIDYMMKYHPLSLSCICNHLIPFYKGDGNEIFRRVVLATAKRIGTYTRKSNLVNLDPYILISMAYNFSKWLQSDDGDTTIRSVIIKILDSVNTQYRTGKHLARFNAEVLWQSAVAINNLLEEGEIDEVIRQTAFVLANVLIKRFENNEITHYRLNKLSYLVKSLSYWSEDPDLDFRNVILLAILALAKSFRSKYFREENAPHYIDFNYANLADGFGSWCKYDDDVQTLRGAMDIIGLSIHRSYINNAFNFSCEKDFCLLVMALSNWCGDDQYIRRAASDLAYIISGTFFYEIETFTPRNLSNLALAFSKWTHNDKRKVFQQAIQVIARTVTETYQSNKLENYDTSDFINLVSAFLKLHGRDDEDGSLRKATLDIARTVTSNLKTKKKLERYLPAYLQILAHSFRKWNDNNAGSDSDSDTVSSEGNSSDNGVREDQTFKEAVLAIASVVRNHFHENSLRDYSLFEVCILSKAFAKWHQESEMLDTIILIATYVLIHNHGRVKVCNAQCLSYLVKAFSAWYYKDDPEEFIKTAVEAIALVIISRLTEENSSQVCSANELAAFALHFSKWHEKDDDNIFLMSIEAIANKINLSKNKELADFRAKDLAKISRALGFWPDEPVLQKCVMVIAHKVQNSEVKIDSCKSRYLIYFTTGFSKYLMVHDELISLKILAGAIAVAINAHRPEDFKVYDIPYLNYLNETFSKFSEEQIFEEAVQTIKKAIDLNQVERKTVKQESETPCN